MTQYKVFRLQRNGGEGREPVLVTPSADRKGEPMKVVHEIRLKPMKVLRRLLGIWR